MSRIIKPDASFTPRELFSRMQGAWFEPRTGYIWQDSTGEVATTSGGQTIGKLVDLSAARVASQTTAANRPLFGARRNLLTYSAKFDTTTVWTPTGSAFIPDTVMAPDGTLSGYKIYENSANSTHRVAQTINAFTPLGTTYTISAYIKAAERGFAFLGLIGAAVGGSIFYIIINLTTGQVSAVTESATNISSILINGWWRVAMTGTTLVADGNTAIDIRISADGIWDNRSYQGDGSSGIYICGAQAQLGSTLTDYQRVTTATDYDAGRFPAIRHADSTDVLTATLPDLGGGVFSSAGSVYFSTPSGMSCLHNQSIGTSYNLPALQTDIYGTVITPARLAPPLEQRLALYMHRLAGLADADFFWQEQATDGMTGQLLADDNDTILLRA